MKGEAERQIPSTYYSLLVSMLYYYKLASENKETLLLKGFFAQYLVGSRPVPSGPPRQLGAFFVHHCLQGRLKPVFESIECWEKCAA